MKMRKRAITQYVREPAARIAIAALLVLPAACNDSKDGGVITPAETVTYQADLYRTEGGFPHVVAQDWGSIGFGTGYGDAQDNVCIVARNILKHRAQLSEFFGPDGGNRDSDFFYALLEAQGIYDVEIDPEMEQLFTGYAAGFNRYLRDTGIENLSDPECQGASWIMQMSVEDVRHIHLTPAFLPNFSRLLFPAAPDLVVSNKKNTTRNADHLIALVNDITAMRDKGSNGVAIGRELSANRKGLLYTNPHLGPDLTFRFSLMHHIIPGVMNMLGANAYDRANVGFGTNGMVAWTNTVSASRSFNWYRLDLVPGDPFRYIYDGETRQIEPTTVSIKVKTDSGELEDASFTFYSSHYGPMLGLIFTWADDHAYSLRIADEGARGFQGGALALQRAQSVREMKGALNKYTSIPGTNIIAADSSGETLYIDSSPTPNLGNQQFADCTIPGPAPFGPEIYGNGAACEWRTDEDSSAPGLVGGSQQPFLYRFDYVTNSNDSFWLANPNAPITGALDIYGDTEDERTLRTRSGLRMIQARQDGTDGLPGNKFDIDSLLNRMLSNQHIAGQLLRDDLVTLCKAQPMVALQDATVDISEACTVLENWDLAANLESRGAHLFREFLRAVNAGDDTRFLPGALNYAEPFSLADPVATPRGLTMDNPRALEALAQAVVVLETAGIALDAQLGDLQSVTRKGERIPLHGGEEWEGVFNKMSLDFAGAAGYPEITGSSASWIMAVEFTDAGLNAKGNLTYSQSTDVTSPHFSDQTKLFSKKQFIDIPYSLEDVKEAAISSMSLSEGSAQCAAGGWQDYVQPGFLDENACRNYFSALSATRLTDYVAR